MMKNDKFNWEFPVGHVKKGETALEAAKRELFEETSAIEIDILLLWDYSVFDDDGVLNNSGRVYFAEIRSFTDLHNNSEIKKLIF